MIEDYKKLYINLKLHNICEKLNDKQFNNWGMYVSNWGPLYDIIKDQKTYVEILLGFDPIDQKLFFYNEENKDHIIPADDVIHKDKINEEIAILNKLYKHKIVINEIKEKSKKLNEIVIMLGDYGFSRTEAMEIITKTDIFTI